MNNELYHYGILGMKWGVRRYQNKDGTLTSKGKTHYRKLRKDDYKTLSDDELRRKTERLELENRYNQLNPSKTGRGLKNIGEVAKSAGKIRGLVDNDKGKKVSKRLTDTSNSSSRVADKITKSANRKKVSHMSDAELKKVVDRMQLEQRYLSRSGASREKGLKKATEILDTAGDVIALGMAAVAAYKFIKSGAIPKAFNTASNYADDIVMAPIRVKQALVNYGYHSAMAGDEDGYLRHFGIKGMKWGVRRYQNEEGKK